MRPLEGARARGRGVGRRRAARVVVGTSRARESCFSGWLLLAEALLLLLLPLAALLVFLAVLLALVRRARRARLLLVGAAPRPGARVLGPLALLAGDGGGADGDGALPVTALRALSMAPWSTTTDAAGHSTIDPKTNKL